MITDEKLARINELARKAKAEGLTSAETKERDVLRREYIEAVRANLRGQLNNINIQELDGSITNLGEKYGKKRTLENRFLHSGQKQVKHLCSSRVL